MKRFGAAILQLDALSSDIILQEVKQVIRPSTYFFYSLLLHPPTTINDLFQRGNQYAMLEDDIVVVTKRTVAKASNSRHHSESKGKRGRDDQDKRGKHESRDSRRTSHRNEAGESGEQVTENLR